MDAKSAPTFGSADATSTKGRHRRIPAIYCRYTRGITRSGEQAHFWRVFIEENLESTRLPQRRSKSDETKDGTLTDRAYRELKELFVTLQLFPGTVLSEQALALRLKIGRTLIRRKAQQRRAVRLQERAGTYVCPTDIR